MYLSSFLILCDLTFFKNVLSTSSFPFFCICCSYHLKFIISLFCSLNYLYKKKSRCTWNAVLSLILILHYNTPLKLVCPSMALMICSIGQQTIDRCLIVHKWSCGQIFIRLLSAWCPCSVRNILLCCGERRKAVDGINFNHLAIGASPNEQENKIFPFFSYLRLFCISYPSPLTISICKWKWSCY